MSFLRRRALTGTTLALLRFDLLSMTGFEAEASGDG